MPVEKEESNLWTAASDNDIELVKRLLNDPTNDLNVESKDEQGYTCLHAACSYGYIDLLQYLIVEMKANVSTTDEDGDTPLFACESKEAADILIANGADIYYKNEQDFFAAEIHFEDENEEMMEYWTEKYPEVVTQVKENEKERQADFDEISDAVNNLVHAQNAATPSTTASNSDVASDSSSKPL